MKTKIAIFASGGGSNAQAIIEHFEHSNSAEIRLVVTNNASAYVLERAEKHGIPSYIHQKEDILNGKLESVLKEFQIDFIVLAGYLKKISPELVKLYPNRIVNIHPALLPAYGGKGMYGMHVHRAVFNAKEKISGITIHYVNENYDEGNTIEQQQCDITNCETPEEIGKAVLKLEHQYYPKAIERLL